MTSPTTLTRIVALSNPDKQLRDSFMLLYFEQLARHVAARQLQDNLPVWLAGLQRSKHHRARVLRAKGRTRK